LFAYARINDTFSGDIFKLWYLNLNVHYLAVRYQGKNKVRIDVLPLHLGQQIYRLRTTRAFRQWYSDW